MVPKPLAWILVAISVLLMGWMNLDLFGAQVIVTEPLYLQFKSVLWEHRALDVLLQVVLHAQLGEEAGNPRVLLGPGAHVQRRIAPGP